MRVSTPFLTDSGRVRIGWRLSGYLGVTLLVALPAGWFLPEGLPGGAAALLLGSLVAGWLLLGLDGREPAALGFHLSRDGMLDAVRGIALGLLIGIVVVGTMAAFGGASWVGAPGSFGAWLAAAVGALGWFAIPAAAEEAFVRGYPLQAAGELWGGRVAVVGTSLVFGALHLGNPGSGPLEVVNVTAAGLLLGAVYVRTLSLWCASGVHLGWNWALGFLADVRVSGLDVIDAPLYDGLTHGPTWLGGGAFGPEGSLVTTVGFLAAAALAWWSPLLRPSATAAAAGSLMATKNTK